MISDYMVQVVINIRPNISTKLSSTYEFELISNQNCTLRKEKGKDVAGCIITLKKT